MLAVHDADRRAARPSTDTAAALARMWQAQRPDGAWDWLNFGLEPYESPGAVFHGAILAAIAAGIANAVGESDPAQIVGLERLRRHLSENVESEGLFNKAWALVAAAHLDGVLTRDQMEAIVAALVARQRSDGGWALADLGPWRWAGTQSPFAPPGTPDVSLIEAADAYATGLVVYALRQAGVSASDPAIVRGRAWLANHQQAGDVTHTAWAPWRSHSLNHDREHGGPRGEPWRRMFMSDLATAFAVLGLVD